MQESCKMFSVFVMYVTNSGLMGVKLLRAIRSIVILEIINLENIKRSGRYFTQQ